MTVPGSWTSVCGKWNLSQNMIALHEMPLDASDSIEAALGRSEIFERVDFYNRVQS